MCYSKISVAVKQTDSHTDAAYLPWMRKNSLHRVGLSSPFASSTPVVDTCTLYVRATHLYCRRNHEISRYIFEKLSCWSVFFFFFCFIWQLQKQLSLLWAAVINSDITKPRRSYRNINVSPARGRPRRRSLNAYISIPLHKVLNRTMALILKETHPHH